MTTRETRSWESRLIPSQVFRDDSPYLRPLLGGLCTPFRARSVGIAARFVRRYDCSAGTIHSGASTGYRDYRDYRDPMPVIPVSASEVRK